MNVKTSRILVVAATLVASGSAFAQQAEPPVRVKVDGLPPHVATQVQDKAQQGAPDLRRFIERTRSIYELNYGALVVGQPDAAIARKETDAKLASLDVASRP